VCGAGDSPASREAATEVTQKLRYFSITEIFIIDA
jgi:hypothetical protein